MPMFCRGSPSERDSENSGKLPRERQQPPAPASSRDPALCVCPDPLPSSGLAAGRRGGRGREGQQPSLAQPNGAGSPRWG